ncbi:hypothetical protein AL056_07850 [Pseudomonas amygdali pv. morsprunorum]|uniref:Thioesterase n=1 Tax=Pseudomonas syringae TaxID=317 RepID=A0A2K4X254_PSESX|nr:hypothetical protein AL056_07850 [Pseudomonas amygdali pv. morsprunorum]SOS42174.1 thioesterase [Pseudomonas syringae]KWS60752.1 hypothetical protein AL054_07805 [Pseudomonas amygdali pv. morsprunorum]PHX35675.1 hypothetical protein AO282_21715 [Pseudomonas amygdali pv. morsprunorum]POC85543.1 hypothetical protein BKM08_17820 [Pseudomonas amygdali pv. morsprunorum]
MDIPEDLTQSAYFKMLGCELRRLDESVAEVALPLEAHLRNRGNVMHGGAIFSLVDIAMGLACSSSHGFDQRSVTIECKINYVRGVSDGEVLCIAKVLHAGRRTLVVERKSFRATSLLRKLRAHSQSSRLR